MFFTLFALHPGCPGHPSTKPSYTQACLLCSHRLPALSCLINHTVQLTVLKERINQDFLWKSTGSNAEHMETCIWKKSLTGNLHFYHPLQWLFTRSKHWDLLFWTWFHPNQLHVLYSKLKIKALDQSHLSLWIISSLALTLIGLGIMGPPSLSSIFVCSPFLLCFSLARFIISC